MRYILFLLLISSTAAGQTFDLTNPRLWMRDACEAQPYVEWGANPTTGYTFITGGNQNWNNPSVLNYIQVSTAYKRAGNSSYKVYVAKPSENNNANKDVRMEVMWLDPGKQNVNYEWRWAGISIMIPTETPFETRRASIAYDHKESPDDLRTPFGLCIQNGRYHISGRIVGPDGYIEDMGPVIRGQWEDWLLERNWKCDNTGYMRFYKNGQLKWSKYGPNIPCRSGDALICRIQHGWYKWVWETPGGQGEGVGAPLPGEPANAPSAPLVLYMDEIRFGRTTATIEDMLIGGTPTNNPPTLVISEPQTITAPTSTATISVTATDADGTVSSYAWSKSSGPSGGNIASPTSATTNITGLNVGTYVFQVTVTDNDGGVSAAYTTIQVKSAQVQNAPPTVFAGNNKTITLPLDSVYMDGGQGGVNASDPEGGPLTYKWRREYGSGTISSPTALNTWITDLTDTDNKFWLTVTDNKGDTATDFVHVYVNPAPETDYPPVAIVSGTQSITLPLDSAFVDASESYVQEDSIQTYAWTKLSGPSGGTIRSSSSPATVVYDLEEGTYVYRVIITAYNTLKDTATVTITVNPAPLAAAPTVTIAGDSVRYIRNPVSQLTFNGVVTDAASVLWTKVSGPSGGNIVSATNDTTVIKDLVTPGRYIYKLTATGSDTQTASDQIVIWVDGFYIQRFLFKQGTNPARE